MKKMMMLALMLLVSNNVGWAQTDAENAVERLNNATAVLREIMNTPDKGVPEEVLEGAKCVAVVPNMVKGGFIFGAKSGRGVATCRTAGGWSAPAFFVARGGSWGAQIGVQSVDLVMMVMNEKGMERLLASKFELGGEASAAAGPVGRHASAGVDWKLGTEILTYSRAKGLFAGLALAGTSIRQDEDATRAVYGRLVTTKTALTGQISPPATSLAFINAVANAKAQSQD